MAAEVQGPRSKVRVWRDDSDERGPRYWVQVQRPGRDEPEEYSYRQLMGTPANIEEDKLIKQEVQRQQRALEKEWRQKAEAAPQLRHTLEIVNVQSDRSPYVDGFDPTKHMTVYYKLDGRERTDTPASLNKAILAHPERYPPDAKEVIAKAVRDKEKSLREQCRPPETAAGEPEAEGVPGIAPAPENATTATPEASAGGGEDPSKTVAPAEGDLTPRQQQDLWLDQLEGMLREVGFEYPVLVQFQKDATPPHKVDWKLAKWAPRTWRRNIMARPEGMIAEDYAEARTRFEEVLAGPYFTRGILPFELVLDLDVKDKAEQEEQAVPIRKFFTDLGWTFYELPTGGKGRHFHAFIDPRTLKLPDALKEKISRLGERDGERYLEWHYVRAWFLRELVGAGVRILDKREGTEGVDRAKIGWSAADPDCWKEERSNHGTQVRMAGCIRPESGRTKTLDPSGTVLKLPSGRPVLNDITALLPSIISDLEEQVERELARPEITVDLPGQLDSIGCIRGLVDSGAPKDFRNNVWFRLSTLAAAAGAGREELDAMLEKYATACTRDGHDSAGSLVSEYESTTASGMKQACKPDAPRKSCAWLRHNITTEYCTPECPMLKAREEAAKPTEATQPVVVDKGYRLDLAEPYIEDDGSPAVVVIKNGTELIFKKLDEWKEAEPELWKDLMVLFPKRGHRWNYSPRPVLPRSYEDIRRLHADIVRCNNRYIELPNDEWPSVLATWQIGSYLVFLLKRSPILALWGPTVSGKGQVLDQVCLLCYRGKKYIKPNTSPLFRQADRWKMSFALDELQDLPKEEFDSIMGLVKGSFDGTPVPRFNINTGEVEEFQTRAFFAVSFKHKKPKEDVTNRGLLLTMRMNSKTKEITEGDTQEHREIRARLLGLRLKVLTDPTFLKAAMEKVRELGDPKSLGFDRRPKDIAVSLLLPAVLSGEADALINTIKKSTGEARDAVNSTIEARVQYVIEGLWKEIRKEIDTENKGQRRIESGKRTKPHLYVSPTIRDKVLEGLREDGELGKYDAFPTQRITDSVRTLGYVLKSGNGGNKYIDMGAEQNQAAYATNCEKYAFEDESKEDGAA